MLLSSLLFSSALPLGPAPGQAGSSAKVTVYFANWNVYTSDNGQVKDLPWDRLDRIHHAFWKIVPAGAGFAIAPADAWADLDPQNPKAHFPQYEAYAARYPGVEILLSIGGWTCSGYFSQMALTPESRKSFIDSCIRTLEKYPFLAGIDLDWEYPGVPRSGSGKDEGNPVRGDDWTNYTLLIRETRAALDQRFGAGKKRLTVCAGAAESILEKQDYAAIFPFVDCISLMTYDMAGSQDAQTGHHTPLFGTPSADAAVRWLREKGVPAGKIAIGSPLYCHGWKNLSSLENPLGARADGMGKGGTPLWREADKWEKSAVPPGTSGWHAGYDGQAQAAYLWNDDPASAYFGCFFTYESARSLDAKLQYILDQGLQGIIVWESGGDKPGWPMLTRMGNALHP